MPLGAYWSLLNFVIPLRHARMETAACPAGVQCSDTAQRQSVAPRKSLTGASWPLMTKGQGSDSRESRARCDSYDHSRERRPSVSRAAQCGR